MPGFRSIYTSVAKLRDFIDDARRKMAGTNGGIEPQTKLPLEAGLEEGLEEGLEAGLEEGLEAGIEEGLEAAAQKGIRGNKLRRACCAVCKSCKRGSIFRCAACKLCRRKYRYPCRKL